MLTTVNTTPIFRFCASVVCSPEDREDQDLRNDGDAVADRHVGDSLHQRHGPALLHRAPLSIGQQLSCESSDRMRCDQRDHSVATEPKPVHPVGQPISASTNSGFKVRGVSQERPPTVGVTRTWRPSSPFTGGVREAASPRPCDPAPSASSTSASQSQSVVPSLRGRARLAAIARQVPSALAVARQRRRPEPHHLRPVAAA